MNKLSLRRLTRMNNEELKSNIQSIYDLYLKHRKNWSNSMSMLLARRESNCTAEVIDYVLKRVNSELKTSKGKHESTRV